MALPAWRMMLMYCNNSCARLGNSCVKTLIYVVKTAVHCSISVTFVAGWVAQGWIEGGSLGFQKLLRVKSKSKDNHISRSDYKSQRLPIFIQE